MNPVITQQVVAVNPYLISIFATLFVALVVAVVTQLLHQYRQTGVQESVNTQNHQDHLRLESAMAEEKLRQDSNLDKDREEAKESAARLEELMKGTVIEQKETNSNLQKLIAVVQEVISNNRAISTQQSAMSNQIQFDQARLRDLEATVSELKGFHRAKLGASARSKVLKTGKK